MPIITLWSKIGKETGQTGTAIALATEMAIDHNNKILLLSTNYNNDDIASAFWNYDKQRKGLASLLGGSKKVSLESGIQGLAKVANSNKLTPELITNYTKIVFKNRLEILEEYKENDDEDGYELVKELYPKLIRHASLFYDYVIVDLEKVETDFTKDILEASDVIVYSINQKLANIDTYMETIRSSFLSTQIEKIIPFIGRYDSFSKYNTKNITRYIGQKKEINAIPYNTLFSEALDEGSIADLFLKFKAVKNMDRNSDFMTQVRKLSDNIIYRIQEIQMKKMQF